MTALVLLLALLSSAALLFLYGRALWHPIKARVTGGRTLASALEEFGPAARARMAPRFEEAGISYPPESVALLAIKDEKRLEVWAEAGEGAPSMITAYAIRAASGNSGPKLREGDRQVPEGLYRIEGLNPNSSYHLSLRVNYPNEFDLARAAEEGRTEPGSDIYIHGREVSIGCLAMGDEVAEDLFVLAADVGAPQVRVTIAPRDPRRARLDSAGHPDWVGRLYEEIERDFALFPRPSP